MNMASTKKMALTHKLETCNSVRCIIYYLKKLLMAPHLDRHSKTDFKPEILSVISTGSRIWHNERNVCGIGHAHMLRKDDMVRIFVKLSIVKTVKEVSAVCQSFLDWVIIFRLHGRHFGFFRRVWITKVSYNPFQDPRRHLACAVLDSVAVGKGSPRCH